MKRFLLSASVLLMLLLSCAYVILGTSFHIMTDYAPTVQFRCEDGRIQIGSEEQWTDFEVLGVNMGTGYPGLFPNESGISAEVYEHWFKQIAQMHANVVRVYKIQSPAFYDAFLRYNETHEHKLYLLQGADFSNQLMYTTDNLLTGDKKEELLRETELLVRALHGDAMTFSPAENKMHVYLSDVSHYVLGYVLGVEWDELFVEYMCRINPEVTAYDGTYLRCEEANAFEVFLAQWGDSLLRYEQDQYNQQHLMSFCNWPLTDPFYNEFEHNLMEQQVGLPDTEALVDLEHILTTPELNTGLFASYNVYPYYPYFLQTGPYTEYLDENGERNPYEGYLHALTEHHSYPVVITEYGVSASRDVTYEDRWFGMNHGGLTEEEQGKAVVKLLEDIRQSDCAGSIVFTWQDEWYKTAWNEKLLSDPEGRAYWSNAQCSEQSFGLLAFEPNVIGRTVYPDGTLEDWAETSPLAESGPLRLSMQSDERFLYFLLDGIPEDSDAEPVNIALDVTPKSGAMDYAGSKFSRGIDFILHLDGRESSTLLVHEDYDSLLYSALGGFESTAPSIAKQELEKIAQLRPAQPFSVVARAYGNIQNTELGRWVIHEAGYLQHGNANPSSVKYQSTADFYWEGSHAEIRIPWQLLNFYNPCKAEICDDFLENGYKVRPLSIDAVYAAPYTDGQPTVDQFGTYTLSTWLQPTWHERLKPSYYHLQEALEEITS